MRRIFPLFLMILPYYWAQATIDLTVTAFNSSAVATNSQTLSVNGTLAVTVNNSGAAPAGAFALRVFEDRNNNATFDGADLQLGSANIASLAASSSVVANVTLAGTVQFAGNILYAQVDSGSAISESNEGNNLRHSGQSSVFTPVSGPLNPAVLWQRTSFTQLPFSAEILSTPAVGDLDGDGFPEIVLSTFAGNESQDGNLRVLDGRNGAEKFTVTDPALQLHPGAGVTIADIDADNRPEIISFDEACHMIAFEHDGAFKWRGAQPVPGTANYCWSAVSVADLDHNGTLELIAGRTVYNTAGVLIWTGAGPHNGASAGALSAVADIDLDGNLEVIAGATAYRADGTIFWNRSATYNDGSVAIGNLDGDPQAEIVFKPRIGFDVVVLEHDGTTKWTVPWLVGSAGAPTIGNFDADPEPEIGIAGLAEYRVYEANGTLKWANAIDDGSSGVTSASLFDFNNDGMTEIVFADQSWFYIWRGSDGAELYKTPRFHATAVEMPIVADVDADGHADVVVGRTNYLGNFNQGLVVYRGADNNWANTRRIWNQPIYSITHILDNLTVPTTFTPNWQTPGLNNFRLNTFLPGTALPNSASDLTMSYLRRTDADFPAKTLLTARVGNGGASIAPAVQVRFTLGVGGATLCQVATTVTLSPGQFQDVTCEWLLPAAGTQNIVAVVDPLNLVNEGDETNNTAAASLVIGLGPISTVDDTTVRSRDAAIDLKWTPVTGATSYNIYRRTAIGTYALHRAGYVNNLGAFADTGLTNNTVYWYNVRWLNAQGVESPLGTEGSAMPIPRTQRNDTAPTITSTPTTRARVLQQYRYLPVVADPDPGDTKVFSLLNSPTGLTINPSTGEMLFTPGANQGGTHRVLWQVVDSRSRTTSQGFSLFVETQVINLPPVITSSAITGGNAGRPYSYNVRAIDPDAGDLLTFSLNQAPSGLFIHPTTGLISWLPSLAQLGQNAVTVAVRDIVGFTAIQAFQINVTNSNRQPSITSTPPASVLVNNTFSYSPAATDPDAGDILTWALIAGPAGATINSSTGLVLFTPTATGPINFTIRVSDLLGANTTQPFTVQVNAIANGNPVFTSTAPTAADINSVYSYQATATDPDNNPVVFNLVSGPAGMTVSITGLVQWTPTAAGPANATIRVQDPLGGFSIQSFSITVGAEDTTPPVITFSSPAVNASLTGDTTITGSVTDANLTSWRIEYQVPGAAAWTLLNTGTTPVNNGPLGVLPVASLADNPYNVRVSAFDRRQGFALALPVRVEAGRVRLGAFTLTNLDLRVPALQMPIEIRRHYDSTKPYSNDFGQGWALAFNDFDLRVDAGFSAFLNLPNGRRVAFQFTPIQSNPLFPTLTNNYTPPSGVFDTLENLDCPQFLGGAQGLVCLGGNTPFQLYQPRNWRLSTRDGVVYTIADGKVSRIEDRNGAWTNIAPTGITTSSGRNVVFARDSAGRITQITDALGRRLLYSYDNLGRLTNVLDQENRQTTYSYFGASHLIAQVVAAGGCNAVRQEFDLSGRITARIDAAGQRTEYTYDLPNRRTTTLYPGGITTVQAFDPAGNLISFTDGRSLVWTFTYDAGGRRLSMTTPTNRVIQRTYDAVGNPTTESFGPAGGPFQISTYLYNALNLLDRVTRPNGDYQTYTYDARGNNTALRIYNAANGLVEEHLYTYDSTGKLINSNNLDGVFNYSYDSSGNPLQRIDASLRAETVNYDALGNPVAYFNGLGQRSDASYDGYGNAISYLTNSLAFATIAYNDYLLPTSIRNGANQTYSYSYDCAPALTRVTDPASQQTNYTRNPFSLLSQQTDALTRQTNYIYNGNGNETLMTSPAADTLGTAYNGENLISSLTNANGTASYAYDAYSRLQTETLPSASLTYNRDLRGRATSVVTTGSNAGTHTNTYDAANHILTTTDRFNYQVAYTYDLKGRRSSMTAPDGTITQYTYDAGGKIQRIQTGSDFAEYSYDAAGRRSQLLYSNGVRATYAYDSRNRITSLVWLSPASTVIRSYAYTYDSGGHPTQVTLNDGSISRSFDSLGRLTAENLTSTLWGNRSGAWTYDALGNRLDAGATFGQDHRILTKDSTTFTYSPAGNQSSQVGYGLAYDVYNRNIGVTYTNYTYDHLGRRNEANGFDGRRFVFDQENVLQIAVGGALTYRYTTGLAIDELLFVRNHGSTRFFLSDHQGSVIGLADSSGALLNQYAYDAWGNLIFISNGTAGLGTPGYNQFLFQGRDFERFVELYHFRAREYSPGQGRFVQKDPERGNEFLPLSRHPYLFALNRPVTFVDPSGREAELYAALITQNKLAEGGGYAAGFSVGFSGATLSFVGHFLGEFLKDPTADVKSTMATAATFAINDITKVVEEFKKRVSGKKGKETSVGTGLSEGAPEGVSTFSTYINGLIR